MASPQHARVFSPNSADTKENSPVETVLGNSTVPNTCLNPQPESSIDLNQGHQPQEEIISYDPIDLSVAAEAGKYPVVTLLQALAGLFRTRQRKDNGWDNYDRETDLLIATMIETILQITSGMIASDVQMQEEVQTLNDKNEELERDLAHSTGRIDQLGVNYKELHQKSRAWKEEAIQLRNANQALRAEVFRYQNQQGAAIGQAPGALFNEEGRGKRERTSVAGNELHMNSDETGPPKKMARFPSQA